MALNIKDRATEEIVRKLAAATGKSITDAVRLAALDKLRAMDDDHQAKVAALPPEQRKKFEALKDIRRRAAALPILDNRSEDEILGYNERGTFD
jgi:antitoxin VapB